MHLTALVLQCVMERSDWLSCSQSFFELSWYGSKDELRKQDDCGRRACPARVMPFSGRKWMLRLCLDHRLLSLTP